MRWPRYGQMKASGVAWLGEVPGHWGVAPVKSRLVANDGGAWGEDIDEDGVIVLRSTDQTMHGQWSLNEPAKRRLNRREALATRLEVGDLVITKSSGSSEHIGKTSLVDEEIAALQCGFSNFMQRLRVDARTYPRFAWYLLNCPIGRAQFDYHSTTSSGLANLTRGTVSGLLFTWPPFDEQRVIAAFLDRETARIDALVASKRRLISLLQEKRATLIARAVTRGLDPDVPTKDSGVAWLGWVPAHWQVMPLKRQVERITSGSRGWAGHYIDTGAVFLRIGNLTRDSIHLDLSDVQHVEPPPGAEGERTLAQAGDLVVSITAYLGSVAVVPAGLGPAYVSQHVALVRPRLELIDPRWLAFNLMSRLGQQQLQAAGYGGTKVQLGLDDVGGTLITAPPREEQVRIGDQIERRVSALSLGVRDIERTIARLTEYRSTLITSAVTGRIDARAAA